MSFLARDTFPAAWRKNQRNVISNLYIVDARTTLNDNTSRFMA
jgi:hypothetical protein